MNDAPITEEFVSVSVGETDACALRENGSIYCWGISEPQFPASSGFTQVEVGHYCACALNDQGLAICWGAHGGTCAEEVQQTPFKDIGVGDQAACGLSEADGSISCWGAGAPDLFANIPGGGQYLDLDVGGNSACALNSAGKPVCWGQIEEAEEEQFTAAYEWIVVGPNHACARQQEGGGIDCWGGCDAWPEICDDVPAWSKN